MVVDVAHATEGTVKQAVTVSTKPLLLFHTALRGSRAQGATPLTERQITPDHARAVAQTGGSIGIWHFFPNVERYVDGVKEMVDIVGISHVSIGTDQGRNPGLFSDDSSFTRLADAMLRGAALPPTPPRSWAETTCGSSPRRPASVCRAWQLESSV